jgi:uncharacterized protein with WD repeat
MNQRPWGMGFHAYTHREHNEKAMNEYNRLLTKQKEAEEKEAQRIDQIHRQNAINAHKWREEDREKERLRRERQIAFEKGIRLE